MESGHSDDVPVRVSSDDTDAIISDYYEDVAQWKKYLTSRLAAAAKQRDIKAQTKTQNRLAVVNGMLDILQDSTGRYATGADKVAAFTQRCIENRDLFELTASKKEEETVRSLLRTAWVVSNLSQLALMPGMAFGFKKLKDYLVRGKPIFESSPTKKFKNKMHKQLVLLPLLHECDLYIEKLDRKQKALEAVHVNDPLGPDHLVRKNYLIYNKIQLLAAKKRCVGNMRDILTTPIAGFTGDALIVEQMRQFEDAFRVAQGLALVSAASAAPLMAAPRDIDAPLADRHAGKRTRILVKRITDVLLAVATFGLSAAYSAGARGTINVTLSEKGLFKERAKHAIEEHKHPGRRPGGHGKKT